MPDKHSLSREAFKEKVKLSNLTHFLGFGFGTGLAPFAPGTFGSLAALPIILLLQFHPWWSYLIVTTLAVSYGVIICQRVADDLGVHDHPAIVWDEIAGMLITFIAIPLTPLTLLLGFVLFRFFDIVKPFPIRFIDKKVEGGLGIMLDDVIAGIFAAVALRFLLPLI
ncbi:phosphatidylglycerophosphatase A family protein [Alteromonas sp. a30]|uniref:phosphatidylglycerophosphatase A family protein n=1 Tax=Alteromonas sp. a30 TaxID=2730917 RepID=UPI00227F8A71|nr:phosphatidylglycerophosphatase A [Alteromonas sp. a30]MCY7295883.1 phosphatidylglycerophosphatase A [Alteromonas sp. a30]